MQWVPGNFRELQRSESGDNYTPHLAPSLMKECSYTFNPTVGLKGLFEGELCLTYVVLVFSRSVPNFCVTNCPHTQGAVSPSLESEVYQKG